MGWSNADMRFEPWPGDENRYDLGIQGKKVLVLGESHYHSCEDDPACREAATEDERRLRHRKLTCEVVDWWRGNPHRSPVSRIVPQLFGMAKAEFWSSVVFYNYVQEFAGLAARVRPTEELWSEALNALPFQAVIDHFEPDRILVLGKKLWSNLPSHVPPLAALPEVEPRLGVANNIGSYNDLDEHCYWYLARTGKRALAMPIMHPSAPRFRLEEWRQPVASWLSF